MGNPTNTEETWVALRGFPKYQLSSFGRLRRAINRGSHKHRNRPWKYLKGEVHRDGHVRYALSVNNKVTRLLAHRLVYSVFVGPLFPDLVVCHKDGNPQNNHYTNLLQATQKQNMQHKELHGTHQKGERHPRSVHTDADALTVLEALQGALYSPSGRLRRGELARLSEELELSSYFISHIKAGRSWTHVKAMC